MRAVAVRDAQIAKQNEIIALLAKHLEEMREEMQKTRDLAKLAITASTPPRNNRRPPPYFPSSNFPMLKTFPVHSVEPVSAILRSLTIDLTIPNPIYTSSS